MTKKWFLIFIVLALIAYFLPQVLVKMSLIFEKSNKTDTKSTDQSTTFISPPTLEDSTNATNSAQFKLVGYSEKYLKIEIYINDLLKDEAIADKNGKFEEKITLFEGDNLIKTIATDDKGNKSNPSKEITVSFKKNKPKLVIDKPENESTNTHDKKIQISGKTDPDAELLINDRWMTLKTDGSFSYNFDLKDGENKFTIKATDQAGNSENKTLTVTYSPN